MNERHRHAALGWTLVAIGLVGAMIWFAGWTGTGASRAGALVRELAVSTPLALLWLLAAAGWGWPFARRLASPGTARLLAVPVGAAVLMTAENALGRLGALDVPIVAWGAIVAGALAAVPMLRAAVRDAWPAPAFVAPCVLPAAILLVAATSAPGWLWASEFGGYDALSYHLQLPREWLAHGRLAGLEHNVYSHLPSFVESAYLHLAALRGDAIATATAAQLLHAGFTIMTAILVARLAARRGGPVGGAIAAALVLGTPWVVVVGSLAYNEMAACMFLAGGLLALDDAEPRTRRTAVLVGVLAAAAVGAKLTAIGFVALPLALLLACTGPVTIARRAGQLATAAGAGTVILLAWWIGSWIDTGSPVFPFLTSIFGTAHWSAEQTQAWHEGHVGGITASVRLAAAWEQLFAYGFGAGPPREPWAPQWSILPWLAVAALTAGLTARRTRHAAARDALVIAVQLVFWIALTHVKSRFMLPAVVPAALAVSNAAVMFDGARGRKHAAAAVAALLLVATYAVQPLLLFRAAQTGGPAAMIGNVAGLRGDLHAEALGSAPGRETTTALLATAPPAWWINHALDPGDRVLLVGEATPFYYRLDRIVYATVWDRGPLSTALDTHDHGSAGWVDALRDEGFTHVLANPVMLDLWEAAGWGDPRITSAPVLAALETRAEPVHRFASGLTLFRLANGRTRPAPDARDPAGAD